jgi:hypothetical protein
MFLFQYYRGVPWTGSCATASAKIACETAMIACDICEAARIAAQYARIEVCCENRCCLCDNELFLAGIECCKLHNHYRRYIIT